MANKGKFLSLILVVLMMMAAAITVNKTIFGHSLEKTSPKEEQSITESDEVTVLPDGNVIIHTKGMPKTVDGYAGLAHYQNVSGKPASNTPWKIWVALAVTLAACIAWFIHARIRKTQN